VTIEEMPFWTLILVISRLVSSAFEEPILSLDISHDISHSRCSLRAVQNGTHTLPVASST